MLLNACIQIFGYSPLKIQKIKIVVKCIYTYTTSTPYTYVYVYILGGVAVAYLRLTI